MPGSIKKVSDLNAKIEYLEKNRLKEHLREKKAAKKIRQKN